MADGGKAVEDLVNALQNNYNWSEDSARDAAERATNLPRFPTYNSFYLATALQFERQLETLKKKPKTPKEREDLVKSILASAKKRGKRISAEVAAREPYSVVTAYLMLKDLPEQKTEVEPYSEVPESEVEESEEEEEYFSEED